MSDLRELQLFIVEMMKDVDKLFHKNNIAFLLLGGSVLGAIRHKGFIPWDDDMDIGVLRKDFDKAERLLDGLTKYKYQYAENSVIPDAPIGHLHLVNKQYKIDNSPTIDLFAIDTVPELDKNRKKYRFIANLHHISVLKRPPQNRGKFYNILFSILFKIFPKRFWDNIQNKTLNYISQYSNTETGFLGNVFGAYTEKEYFNSDMYKKTVLKEFEGLQLPIPCDYDNYLKQLYGDYMKLPPKENRIPKHRNL